jgi:SAM-dependent methyltransferase
MQDRGTDDAMLTMDFWQSRYDTGNIPWDLGQASPHFAALLQSQPEWLKPGKLAALGCGRGHDAALFARAGFETVGFDYAPGAIQEAQALYGQLGQFQQANIFDLADPKSSWAGQFDYALEHTCFCAILPQERPAYVNSLRHLLKPNGLLIGVFWEHEAPDGPPFSTPEAQIREAFEPDFAVVSMQALAPADDRKGTERLVVLRRTSEV